MFKDLFFIFSLISRKKLFLLFILITIFTFLEAVGIGLVFPLLLTITEGNNLEKFNFLIPIQNFLNISSTILLILTLTVSAFFLKFIVSLIFSYFQSNEIYNFEQEISNFTLKNFLYQNFKKLSSINSSEIINNTITQCSIVSEYVIKNIFGLIADLILITGILFVLFIVSPKLSIVCVCYSLIIIISVNLIIRKKLRELGEKKQMIDQNKLQTIQETFSIIRNIKLQSLEKFFFLKFKNENINYRDILSKEFFISTIPRFFIEFSSVFLFVLILVYYNLNNSDLIKIIPSIALLGAAGARLIPALSRLQFYFVQIRFGLPVIKKIKEVYYSYNKLRLNYIQNIKEKDKINFSINKISIKNLSFKFDGDNQDFLFKNMDFELKKGDILGIKGKSGSGKTTLIDIISGLLKPTSGSIKVNDTDIEKDETTKKFWMSSIGYVPQEIYLIDSTIEKNLFLFNQNSDVNLKNITFLNFIKELPNQLQTRVGEKGNLLS